VSSGVKKFTDAEIDEILVTARRHNTDSGITGALFDLEGNFCSSPKAMTTRLARRMSALNPVPGIAVYPS
jgi:hypothetical protein